MLVADAGIAALEYPLVFNAARQPINNPFTTLRPSGTLFGEYRVADSVGINTTLRYTANVTEVVVGQDKLQWKRFEAFLGVRWFL